MVLKLAFPSLFCLNMLLQCNNESAREDHFLDIPLVIKPFGAEKAYSSVVSRTNEAWAVISWRFVLQEEALDGFVDPETLNGDNQYYCDQCKKKCDAHKVCCLASW